MILKPQDQRIYIWRHHSGAYYHQPYTTTTSDNGRSINIIANISIEEQLLEVRLQEDVRLKEYQRLQSEKKKSDEKPDTYPPNTCVLMIESILMV